MDRTLVKLRLYQSLALLFLLVTTGCSNLTLTIENPSEDDTVYTDDVPMSAYWVGGEIEPSQFKASLNGIDISDFFIVGPTSAQIASGADLVSKMRDGVNTLRVTVDGPHLPLLLVSNNSKFVQFLADKHGPEIHILDVEAATVVEETVTVVVTERDRPWWCRWMPWIPGCETQTETEEVITVVERDTFTVEGYVNDPSGLASLSHTIRRAEPPFQLITGESESTQLDGTDFSFELPEDVYYANNPVLIEITATDNLGRVSKQTFHRSADGDLPSTVGLRDNGAIPELLGRLI